MALADEGQFARAGLYVLLSVVVSLAAVWLGSGLAMKIYGTGAP